LRTSDGSGVNAHVGGCVSTVMMASDGDDCALPAASTHVTRTVYLPLGTAANDPFTTADTGVTAPPEAASTTGGNGSGGTALSRKRETMVGVSPWHLSCSDTTLELRLPTAGDVTTTLLAVGGVVSTSTDSCGGAVSTLPATSTAAAEML
jgi:hypothetical protein